MALERTFRDIALAEVADTAAREKGCGSRFVQMLCAAADPGIDLVYSYMAPLEGGSFELRNYRVRGISAADEVPSVTSWYLSAFPFENEAHDLFGVNVRGNAIDFAGRFYQVAMDAPMTVISPEQKAAREKAAKVAAAKAAKAAKAAEAAKATEDAGAAAGEAQAEKAEVSQAEKPEARPPRDDAAEGAPAEAGAPEGGE